MKTDVLVIGGGSAGLAAAVSAARAGARTILVERHGMLGGMGTTALVHTFCGFYLLDGDRPEIANPGISEEIADRTERATGVGPTKMGRVWVLPQHPVEFASLADRLVRENGVELLFHSELVALEPGSGWRAEIICRGERRTIEAAAVVDASGDAIAAAALRGEGEATPTLRLQRPAYVCGVQGVVGELHSLEISGRIVEGIREGILGKAAMGMHFRASGRPGEVFGTLDLSAEETGEYDPSEPLCLSALEVTGREVAQQIVGYLKRSQAGWKGAYIAHWPMRAGVRESRTWRGRVRLTGEEILSGATHDDDVALATWPLELRETNRGPRLRYLRDARSAGIPAGALQAAGFENLFVAGRCISCDHEAQASIRVMGTCFATGEAAGRMAAGGANASR
jgi:hypothetical protein